MGSMTFLQYKNRKIFSLAPLAIIDTPRVRYYNCIAPVDVTSYCIQIDIKLWVNLYSANVSRVIKQKRFTFFTALEISYHNREVLLYREVLGTTIPGRLHYFLPAV